MTNFEEKRTYLDPLIIGLFVGMLVMFIIMKVLPEDVNIKNIVSVQNATNIFKILFAAFAGGIIGYEREHKNRPAGLRTHALVSIGATIVMLIPLELIANGANPEKIDVTRLGAQVISGIGFLGAGTIIRNGVSVKGLTTAASLWVAAIMGLAIGAGNYVTSLVSLGVVMFILRIFGNFEHRQRLKFKDVAIDIKMEDLPQQIGIINGLIEGETLKLRKMEVIEKSSKVNKNGKAVIKMKLFVRGPLDMEVQDFLKN